MPIQTDNKLRLEVLLELMADFKADRCEPYRQTSAAHRDGLPNVGVPFMSKADREGLCKISEPIQHA